MWATASAEKHRPACPLTELFTPATTVSVGGWAGLYSDMRDSLIAEFNKNQFSDRVSEVKTSYSSREAQVVLDRNYAMQPAMVSL